MCGKKFWVLGGLFLSLSSATSTGITIDDFSTAQGPLNRNAPGDTGIPISSVALGGGVLGGERDIEVNLLSSTPVGNGISIVVVPSSFNHSQDGGIRGTSLTAWDGIDGDGSSLGIDHTGLGGVDLTVGGTHTALLVDIASADLMSTIVFEVFTDALNSSRYALGLAAGAFNDMVVIPYASFVTNLGAGANFANVGAITMLVDGSTVSALDVVLARIETTPQLTASKTDALFVDVDLDGNVDVGDRIKYTITITNPDDDGNLDAPGVIFNDTPDPSTSLFVGSVMTSQGSVTIGNTAGDTTVSVNVGNIADGASVTIMFEVTVTAEDPLVCNQGFAGTISTDDPDTPAPLDPTCTVVTFCGDGIVNDATEECDDGNANDNDDCSNNCTMGCGNDIVNTGESCDGMAEAPGVDCTLPCRDMGSMDECTCCGDGFVQSTSGETCDPFGSPVGSPGETCRMDCTYCGDGVLDAGEDCDDGNEIDGDGCNSLCQFVCGDGALNVPGETCDPPGSAVGSPGETCRMDCTYCGDGVLDSGEDCDDGNEIDGDGCNAGCLFVCGDGAINVPGETCDPPGSAVGSPGEMCRMDCTYCGDGVLDSGEDCDDGNEIDGDGCNTLCQSEVACCLEDDCLTLLPDDCLSMNGIPQGPGTLCTAAEACCLPIGRCQAVDPVCCDDRSGVPKGSGTECHLHGDIAPKPNGDGMVELTDVLKVLDAYNDQSITNADIFPCSGPDGIVELGDVLSLLDSYAGDPKCYDQPCP